MKRSRVKAHRRKINGEFVTVKSHNREIALRLEVNQSAKDKAKRALEKRKSLPKSRQFGLDKESAQKAGVNSGVERAKQLVKEDSINISDAKRVSAFYQRFKNCETEKCEGAIDLWGGRQFGRKATRFVRQNK